MLFFCPSMSRNADRLVKPMQPNFLTLVAAASVVFSGCSTVPTTVPPPIQVPIELRSGMPTATVSIAGEPLRLFVDLAGYNAVALTEAELQRVPVRFLAEPIRSTNAAGEIYESRRFVAPDVWLGGVALGDLEGSEFIFPPTAAPPDRNGYIGFGLLSRFLIVLDYRSGFLRLYPTGSADALLRECGPKTFAIDIVDGVPQSIAETDHGRVVFSWDTGSRRSVIRPSIVGTVLQRGSDRDGAPSHRIEKFVLGGRELGPQTFLLIDYRGITVDGVLGTDFFASRVVCLDAARGVGAIR